MKKILACALALVLLLSACAFASEVLILERDQEPVFDEGAELLRVYFFDTRASDCILLVCGGQTMLVDCADTNYGRMYIAPELEKLGIDHIDYAVNTHPHDDHIGGFSSLFDCVSVGAFYTCFPLDYCQDQIDCLEACRAHGIGIVEFDNGFDLSFGPLKIWVWRDHRYDTPYPAACNACSLFMHVTYGESTLILTADATMESFNDLLAEKGEAIRADVIKMPHHGINRPSYAAFRLIASQVAVVTNSYNERVQPTYQFLINHGCKMLCTGSGIVQAATDGQTWQVVQYMKNQR